MTRHGAGGRFGVVTLLGVENEREGKCDLKKKKKESEAE